MPAKPEWVTQLEAEPCTCVPCWLCKGSGTIYFDLNDRFVGIHRTDDMDNPEPCDQCSDGVEEKCDRCASLNDLDDC